MSVVQPLLDLQEIDGRIREFQQELKDIPERIKQEKARLEEACTALASAQTDLEAAKSKADDIEAEAKKRRDKIAELKKEQSTLKSNSDFRTFNLQINSLETEATKIEANLVIALDDTFPFKERVAKAEKKLAEEQASVDEFVAELEERMKDIQEVMKEAETERAEYVGKVPPRFLAYYERLRTKRWPVVVPLQMKDCICNGCHLVQPPSVGQMVRRNQDIVACQMCGRILYMAD